MADLKILLKKCQELALKFSGKTRKHTLKCRLMDLELDVDELTKNGFDQPSPETVYASVSSFSMSPDNLQRIVSPVMSQFIPLPVPFSLAQAQQLT